ncbi:DUF397 domain-containing protein [Streptomyces fenghuangensis]
MPGFIDWQKSSFSEGEGANCIELAAQRGSVLIRESDIPELIIATSPESLKSLLRGAKNGEFDHLTL